jgi:UDP-N-acetyl-2-amino-2-deoxyglucuronate dehydrogenase
VTTTATNRQDSVAQARSGKRFAIIGVAGYIARRHLDAIRAVGGDLVAACDPFDSVGQINDFPSARFFTEFAQFESYVRGLGESGRGVDYVTICSPNHLHRAHVEFALRAGADAICEKPLALDPADVEAMMRLEKETNRKVANILQLRLNPDNQRLRDELRAAAAKGPLEGELIYITQRGQWYHASWKGDERRSGGLATNIGVHFYDLLIYIFGPPKQNIVHHRAMDCATGVLEFEGARIRWFLSINGRDLPADAHGQKELNKAARRLTIAGRVCDLSGDFTRLHTTSYEEILVGRGFSLGEAKPAIEVVAHIRNAAPTAPGADAHPLLAKVLADKDRYKDGLPV